MEEQTNQQSPKTELNTASAEETKKTNSGSKIPLIIAAVILVIAGLVYLFICLSSETTGKIRDITLIIFALESVITAAAFVVLCVQTAKLINFLKYEVSPILATTSKTAKKLSGTVSFLCDNAVEPTVKAASTISGVKNAANNVLAIFKK